MKKIPHKKIFLALLFSMGAFFVALPIHAAINTSTSLFATQTKNIFLWGIGIASLLSGISFAFGAVEYLVSLEKAETKSDAKDRMWNSLLGFILCLSSLLILRTVNPQIVTLENVASATAEDTGVYYSNGDITKDTPASLTEPSVASLAANNYKTIKYVCTDAKGNPTNKGLPL